MTTVLIADHDAAMRKQMEELLCGDGYSVLTAEDAGAALSLLDRQFVDLVVLEVLLPKGDGLTLCRDLRSAGAMLPIMFVTEKKQPADIRQGFLAGADDYLTKPFDTEEFLLRIRALFRRAQIVSSRRLTVGDVVLDADTMLVYSGGSVLTLPPKEFELLFLLLSYPGKIFTRLQLMDEIWGLACESGEATVNTHITRLRSRLGHLTAFRIVSVRGVGYKAEILVV